MIEYINGYISTTWHLLEEMAPYLLFGFFIAGILRLVLPKEKIYKHLSGNKISSVIKAAIVGVPLPICSCGVIPVSAHLRKEGASKGATVSFLISTPTSGVDSILATYSLMGPVFAVIRPICSFFAGALAGIMVNIFDKEETSTEKTTESNGCIICNLEDPHSHTIIEKIKEVFHYAFIDLVKDTAGWLIIGVLAGGAISSLVPTAFIEKYLGNPYLSYPLMLAIGLPMYVCATASIPIASTLVMKGMSPGAGLIFLIAGPATNTATMSFVAGKLGKKVLAIYLTSIIVTGIIFGILIDFILINSSFHSAMTMGSMEMLPLWIKRSAAIIFSILLIIPFIKFKQEAIKGMGIVFIVPDMTCDHCVRAISSAIKEKVAGATKVNINLKTKEVEVEGEFNKDDVVNVINGAGYKVENKK